jgi:hypothetical protein
LCARFMQAITEHELPGSPQLTNSLVLHRRPTC